MTYSPFSAIYGCIVRWIIQNNIDRLSQRLDIANFNDYSGMFINSLWTTSRSVSNNRSSASKSF